MSISVKKLIKFDVQGRTQFALRYRFIRIRGTASPVISSDSHYIIKKEKKIGKNISAVQFEQGKFNFYRQ